MKTCFIDATYKQFQGQREWSARVKDLGKIFGQQQSSKHLFIFLI